MTPAAIVKTSQGTSYLCADVSYQSHGVVAEDYCLIESSGQPLTDSPMTHPRWMGAGAFGQSAVVLPVPEIVLSLVTEREFRRGR